jgi:hypothetical protein
LAEHLLLAAEPQAPGDDDMNKKRILRLLSIASDLAAFLIEVVPVVWPIWRLNRAGLKNLDRPISGSPALDRAAMRGREQEQRHDRKEAA